MNNTRIIIIMCFVAAFGAGLVAGKLWERTALASSQPAEGPGPVVNPLQPAPVPVQTATVVINPIPPPPEPAGWIKELNLDAKQSVQMRDIWQDAMSHRPNMDHHKRDALRKEKERQIDAALTDDQRKQQVALNNKCNSKINELWNQMRANQDSQRRQCDEAFKALLTDDQKKAIEVASKTYETKLEEVTHDKEWRRTFDDAVAKTRAMLNPEQRIKYDEIRKKHDGPRNGFGPRPDGQREPRGDHPPGDRSPGDRPAGPPGEGPRGEGPPRGDAPRDGGRPIVKQKYVFVLEKVGGSRARVSRPPQATFHA